ncbi:MAG: hypothetical protein RIC89_19330 [Pseudomonadales bacterium]
MSERLVSWKRIARYLDKGERTVRRWAVEEDLPVHKISERANSTVFAFTDEIDAWLDSRKRRARRAPAERMLLAVLPFVSNDEGAELLAEGILAESISALGQLTGIGVIARTSVLGYGASDKSIATIGRELGVQYIVEGSVRAEAQQVRISVQLVSVADQTQVWSQTFDRTSDSGLVVQQELAQQVTRQINRFLNGTATPTLPQPEFLSGPAAEHYYAGRFLLNKYSPDALRESVAAFERAIVLEPRFGPAYGGKAEALQLLTNFSFTPPAEVMGDAMVAINQAVALSPNSAEVFASLGYIHSTYTFDWMAAEEAFHQSLRLNPSLSTSYQWLAEMLAVLGRFDEALERVAQARRYDPMSPAVDGSFGHVLWLARRYDELIPSMEDLLRKEPGYPLAQRLLFSGYFEMGLYAEAYATCEKAVASGDDPRQLALLGELCLGADGAPERLDASLALLEEAGANSFISGFQFALLHTVRGNKLAALESLERACDESVWHVAMTGQCAMFDSLRSEARFDRLLQRIGLYESRYQPVAV